MSSEKNMRESEASAPRSGDDAEGREPDARIPLRRALVWAAVAIALIAGLYFYFHYAGTITPVLERDG
ncbi:MAG: hypothetical protein ACRENI_01835 [Gemmatimonadaceae bacterium]